MREVKFRAWNNLDKKMVNHVHALPLFNNLLKSKYYNLMQYTGLKDINGVEIYEGDIVEERRKNSCWTADMVQNLEVKFERGKFIVGRNSDLHGSIGVTYKVIGNKYENPELLEK